LEGYGTIQTFPEEFPRGENSTVDEPS